jgi:hypothetical protein
MFYPPGGKADAAISAFFFIRKCLTMNIHAWADTLEPAYYKWGTINAYPKVPLPYIEVLEQVQGMTTPSTMHLLNLAVQQLGPGECYLEVGTWRGATLIGALLNTNAKGYAIDDDSMDDHDEDEQHSELVWWKNVQSFGMGPRVEYVNGSVPAVWEHLGLRSPVGVYLFDGDKSTVEAAYAGLAGVLPFLADEALIFVDDANEVNIRMAVHQLEQETRGHLYKILDVPTPANCWPCFWNGIMALAWKRQ